MMLQIQVRGSVVNAGHRGWVPAVTGSLNQTRTPDGDASTFDGEVPGDVVDMVLTAFEPEDDDWRIVEV